MNRLTDRQLEDIRQDPTVVGVQALIGEIDRLADQLSTAWLMMDAVAHKLRSGGAKPTELAVTPKDGQVYRCHPLVVADFNRLGKRLVKVMSQLFTLEGVTEP